MTRRHLPNQASAPNRETPDHTDVIVELRAVPDCPNLAGTRDRLTACLIEAGLPPTIIERHGDFPSPSILIDGVDVTGADPHRPAMCVLEPPTTQQIRTALRRAH
jgi:hypothetical protein